MALFILYFDIGNTTIKVGVARDGKEPVVYTLPTDAGLTADALGLALTALVRREGAEPEACIACVGCSVVPPVARLVRGACDRFFGRSLLLTPEDLPIPLENRYARPHEVGADRLVGAYAARMLFPEPESLICVDYGTATTFDCVAGNAYLGGLICPGVLSSAQSLSSRTAKLPQVDLEVDVDRPEPGKSSPQSLSHGFVFGFAAMTEGLCARLAEGLPGTTLVVGTGGFAVSLAKVARCFDALRPNLLMEGLRLLHQTTHESMTL